MCYAAGSIDHATGVCPMCKVFKPRDARRVKLAQLTPMLPISSNLSSRCPHKQDICHNVALHPKGDIVYLKNAEGTATSSYLSHFYSPLPLFVSRSSNVQRVRILQGNFYPSAALTSRSSIVVCSHGPATQAVRLSKPGLARLLSSS